MTVTVDLPTSGSSTDCLINSDPQAYSLGITAMDDTHREFIDLVNRLGKATGKEFAALFKDLYIHTEAHFSREYEMMKETGFPALEEHYAEHQRILGQLNHFLASVNKGRSSMARAYIREQMPYWFSTHLATMDSALAAHCKSISR